MSRLQKRILVVVIMAIVGIAIWAGALRHETGYLPEKMEDGSGEYEDELEVAGETTDEEERAKEVWDSYTIQVGEAVLTFPCETSDLAQIGWEQNSKYLPTEYQIAPGEREMVWYKDENENSYCVDLINDTDESVTADRCMAYGITVDAGHLGTDGASILFPEDLKIGDSAYTLEAKYGEPDEKREGKYVTSWSWYGAEDGSSGIYVDVDVESGNVDSISLVREISE